MQGLAHTPARRNTIGVVLLALLVAGICWFVGADVWHALLFGAVLTMLGLVSLHGLGADVGTINWRVGSTNRHGARRDVDQLSWSMRGSYGRVDSAAVWRVQKLARHRLALHGLDLLNPADQPRVQQLIGRRAYLVVTRGERRPASLRALLQCLDALDALNALDPNQTLPPVQLKQRRGRNLIPHRPRRTT
jgi:hypothetical protein